MITERTFARIVHALTFVVFILLLCIACSCRPVPVSPTPRPVQLDPDAYDVSFAALVLGGVAIGSATISALITGPICHARGRREVLQTFKRPRPLPRI